MRRRRVGIPCVAALATLAALAPAARADVFEPIQLVSANAAEQADYAHDAAISGDGLYVAFDGSVAGVTGVWRRSLVTGAIEQVAPGDAVLPSISANGQYVSFTTTVALDPADDTNHAPDVYVRNMACDPSEACAFTLASAVDESTEGLSYEYPGTSEEAHEGSLASGRSALSADGRSVAFITTAASNLANPDRPAVSEGPEPPDTPPLQVAVRHLDSHRTELISVLYDPATGHPLLSGAGQSQPVPVSAGSSGAGAVFPGGLFPTAWVGASISADGSTVAWLGQQIEAQAPTLSSEPSTSPQRTEPLWRRVGDSQAATRRVSGGGDPLSPACAASGETVLGGEASLADPCQGPFAETGQEHGPGTWDLGTSADFVPQLSADGRVVAFLASAREIASGEEFRHGEISDDLYVADMADGLTRVQALRRLTEIAGGDVSDVARIGEIVDLGVSPDGSEVAFSTRRTVFPLGSPALVSATAGAAGMVELFDVDLANDTLTRVTQGFNGAPSEEPHGELSGQDPYTDRDGSFSPSFSADGDSLAFSSTASNLVYGDGNSFGLEPQSPLDGSDAFLAQRRRFVPTLTEDYISPGTPAPSLKPPWRLGVSVSSRRDGSVVLYVQVPAAGALYARANAAVRVHTGRTSSRRGHRRQHTRVAVRAVATRLLRPQGGGLVVVKLTLARSYAARARQRGGLSASVGLAFSATGHPVLRKSIGVRFVRTLKTAKARKQRNSKAKRR